MIICKSWYKIGLIAWLLISGFGLILGIYAAGWRVALFGFLFHVSTDVWYETVFDIFMKLINYFPLLALPFAVEKRDSRE